MIRRYRFLFALMLGVLVIAPNLLNVAPVEAQVLGSNWQGSFYNNTTLSGTPAASNIPYPSGLSFNWGNGGPLTSTNAPIPGVGADNFSATFTSTEQFSQGGNYTFTLRFNDGIRLFVNNVTVYDSFGPLAAPDTSGTCVNLCKQVQVVHNIPAGPVQLRVDYVEFTGNSLLQVQWRFDGGGSPILTPTGPTPTPAPIATGQVIRVKGLSLRTGPYLGASLVAVARPGNSYAILERNNDEGLFMWYKIRVGDNTGWVSGRYFETFGNIDAIPITHTIFDEIDHAPDIGVVGVPRAIMNLRRRPSERAALIDKVPWGAEVAVVGRTVQGGRNFWLQVRYNDKVGWISAPYVGLRGIIDAVPIR